eukprot:TRINITY_DN49017_c0_g1_i1.p1 TRINITY_DN49017_c0_g1~~TRINITY_DN49017_c0_g1_i1.p1  ORF type:complete len:253 (+),score=44.89 TRINITY_DN49017_c0_g1_i1:60-761(+)
MAAIAKGFPVDKRIAGRLGTLLFENERTRIFDFRLPAGSSGGVARHEFPTLRWQVGAGVHQMIGEDGSKTERAEVADKQVFWVEAGAPFQSFNAHGSREYRQVCWEFKEPPKRSEAEVRARLSSAIYPTEVGTAMLLDNAHCRVWDFFLEPGEGDYAAPHHHVLDYCFVYVAPGRLLGSHHDGTPGLFDSINEDNDVTWFDIPEGAPADRSFAHGGKNGYEDRPMREYLVEFK